MTYRALIKQLQELPPDLLDFDVTLYDTQNDEFCGINRMVTGWNPDTHSAGGVVDDGTPLLEFPTLDDIPEPPYFPSLDNCKD